MTASRTPEPRRLKLLAPLAAFAGFVIFAITGLFMQNSDLPSAFIGRQAPQTPLPALMDGEQDFNPQDFRGRVTLVNFWGSWCPPCREEHPVLMQLAREKTFDLVGVNYADRRTNALRFLSSFGNPYKTTGHDPTSKTAIEWGVYGPPETFVLGKDGTVLYRHIGVLTGDVITSTLRPIIETANAQ
ncbi:MAG: Periplasmic protein thiol:disulfide oxidoreductase, DsbE subfamily [Candidatus Tokpelaia hoelldobleri]|uniref:Periplasmic protein thiol:disulfide oxidoreductase, DsbE subfamily n=1 Tax=Candidatus Tokpelaia hoelldobleri TaxID=1902579 RepID=A0A1U9JVI7_9HYPH|nr:MAG: Periplasmic protein thiol:disulfide oxidoreductase, DsbE subfamily [Candidatus Tokpelaia hoelldoblerii]